MHGTEHTVVQGTEHRAGGGLGMGLGMRQRIGLKMELQMSVARNGDGSWAVNGPKTGQKPFNEFIIGVSSMLIPIYKPIPSPAHSAGRF